MRLLFTALPIPSHIIPMLPLIKSAVESGHDVTVATGTEGLPVATIPGARVIELGLPWSTVAERYAEHLNSTRPIFHTSDDRQLDFIGFAFTQAAGPVMADRLIQFTRTWTPDIIISDLTELGGRIAATLLGIPHVMHGLGPQQPIHLSEEVGAAIVALQGTFGIPTKQGLMWNEDLYLDVWPENIALDSKYTFRNALPIRSTTPRLDMPADEVTKGLPFERSVYVTLGTMFNTTPGALERLISVFDGIPVNAIVTIGADGDPKRFANPPENVRIRRFVPQDAILPAVDAVLSHGGAATTLGALAHGKPHVMTPVATDQHVIASTVSSAGAGITLAEPSDVADIRSAVLRVLNEPHFAETARLLSPSVFASPDPREVLDLVLDHLCESKNGKPWNPVAVVAAQAARNDR